MPHRKTARIFWLILVLAGLGIALGLTGYWLIFGRNIEVPEGMRKSFYIYSGDRYEDIYHRLDSMQLLKNPEVFDRLAARKNLPSHIYPGHYIISDGMSNNALINLFRSGRQSPVTVTFHNIRTLAELAGRISSQIEPDSLTLLAYFSDPETAEEHGFTQESFPAMFIPNTYELFWNSSPGSFTSRMEKEYERFWNGQRTEKARQAGLSPLEVSVLASIIDEETRFDDEKPTIAGVYLNRLRRGIPLQADPTIKFALGDFNKSRILTRDLDVDSPYNTYRNRGLPPGPIRIPSIAAIDAVLDYEHHDFLYFCARDDFSGYHHFSRTLAEHNRYARRYRDALNQKRIYR